MNNLLQKEYEEFIKRECLIKDGVVTVGLGNLQDWLSAHNKRVLEGVGEMVKKMIIKNPKCYCKTYPEHNCGVTSNEALSDVISLLQAGE